MAMSVMPIHHAGGHISSKGMRQKVIPIDCIMVFALPLKFAGSAPYFKIVKRMTVIPISRTRMSTVIHHGTYCHTESMMSAAPVIALSAIGSMILPKSVMRFRERATIRLGHATVTDDAEGERLGDVAPAHELRALKEDRNRLESAIGDLTGDIEQVPSAVSAIKVGGVRSYARVRGGEEVELAARPIRVERFEIRDLRMAGDFLDVDCVVDCSSGTYIRAIARDLGADLGVGGHLTALRRTRVGDFTVDNAQRIPERDAPRAAEDPSGGLHLTPLGEAALSFLPLLPVSEREAAALRYGQRIEAPQASEPETYPAAAIVPPTGELVAIVEPAPKRGLLKSASVIPRL